MAKVHSLEAIQRAAATLDFVPDIEAGFVAYSKGQAVVPPVGELLFDNPPGDAHIKYGKIIGDDVFVIKVATGFYDNPKKGLPGNSGLMLVFSATTGILDAVLLDEGYLTNVRTALAGAISAKWLAPKRVDQIAVLGTGLQARMQVEEIAKVTGCRNVKVWGRSVEARAAYVADMKAKGFAVIAHDNVGDVTRDAQVIVTTTASEKPLLFKQHVSPGTHIIAMGSDTETKNEIDPAVLDAADIYVADSIIQCQTRGELHHALNGTMRAADRAVELGSVIADRSLGRASDNQITITDLTGVAVQDIAIAKAVCKALGN
jgi:ornithine cyclodeaminase